ncbi:hypothetical protein THERU_05320 [Thermocrinis ruber]|uniref:Uncharacterized protein n=1 Tax=Thermocrinis ruber TaxID=75906 RepID=W0DG11_9AQUI|nr:hypothetical protein [Thermocrinis ruber]AHE96167.1 hypothetical protein THERU_05320 [Thermocrinis ruber]
MRFLFLLLVVFLYSYAKEPFTDLEGVVGYMVVEKNGKVENYMVVEEKGGGVKTIKVNRNPKEFLKKTEDGTQKK